MQPYISQSSTMTNTEMEGVDPQKKKKKTKEKKKQQGYEDTLLCGVSRLIWTISSVLLSAPNERHMNVFAFCHRQNAAATARHRTRHLMLNSRTHRCWATIVGAHGMSQILRKVNAFHMHRTQNCTSHVSHTPACAWDSPYSIVLANMYINITSWSTCKSTENGDMYKNRLVKSKCTSETHTIKESYS